VCVCVCVRHNVSRTSTWLSCRQAKAEEVEEWQAQVEARSDGVASASSKMFASECLAANLEVRSRHTVPLRPPHRRPTIGAVR
jgi:hypothetical protein